MSLIKISSLNIRLPVQSASVSLAWLGHARATDPDARVRIGHGTLLRTQVEDATAATHRINWVERFGHDSNR